MCDNTLKDFSMKTCRKMTLVATGCTLALLFLLTVARTNASGLKDCPDTSCSLALPALMLTATMTVSPTFTAMATMTPTLSATAGATSTSTVSATPSPTQSATPATLPKVFLPFVAKPALPTATPTATPTPTPTATHTPTLIPTATSTHTPTATPTMPPCAADVEDNDLPVQAQQIAPDQTPCIASFQDDPQGEDDYYRVQVNVGQQLRVQVRNLPAGGDYDLVLYDPRLSQVVFSNASGNVDEQAEHLAQSTGLYYIRVILFMKAPADNRYTLTVMVN